MSRYIVTGGAGRLGRSVVRLLDEAGHEVVSLDRHVIPDLPGRQLELDLGDPEATRRAFLEIRPDGVVHLAGISTPLSASDADTFDVNTRLMWSVLEAGLAAGVSALLVASSPTVIGYGAPGWCPVYLPIDEDHPVAPWHGYAVSKVAMEEIVAMAARRYGDQASFGVMRPAYVIAPDEWRGAPTQQGHTVVERLGTPALSAIALFGYVDARDAADFVLAWLENAHRVPNGSAFFVAATDSLVRAPIADALAEHLMAVAPLAADLAPRAPMFSSERAERILQWRAERTWRTELLHHSADQDALGA